MCSMRMYNFNIPMLRLLGDRALCDILETLLRLRPAGTLEG